MSTLVYLIKWNESGFRPPLCTYRLNWARRTSWGWWDDWDDTVLQTQDPKFGPWRSEAEHATSRSRRLPTILTFTRGWGRNNFVSFKPPRPGTEPRTLAWKAAVLTTTPGPPPGLLDRQMAPAPEYKVQLFHYKQVPMAGIGVFFQVSMRSHVFKPDCIIVVSWWSDAIPSAMYDHNEPRHLFLLLGNWDWSVLDAVHWFLWDEWWKTGHHGAGRLPWLRVDKLCRRVSQVMVQIKDYIIQGIPAIFNQYNTRSTGFLYLYRWVI